MNRAFKALTDVDVDVDAKESAEYADTLTLKESLELSDLTTSNTSKHRDAT